MLLVRCELSASPNKFVKMEIVSLGWQRSWFVRTRQKQPCVLPSLARPQVLSGGLSSPQMTCLQAHACVLSCPPEFLPPPAPGSLETVQKGKYRPRTQLCCARSQALPMILLSQQSGSPLGTQTVHRVRDWRACSATPAVKQE